MGKERPQIPPSLGQPSQALMISHHHKVIFVHIPKTGGQSVEQMFLDDLGLSWDERAALTLRPNKDRSIGPNRLAHLYADEYVSKGHVTQAQWDSYTKFAVVRNPYDRIVSEYLYRFQKTPWWKTPFPRRFVRRTYKTDFFDTARHMQPQLRYVTDDKGEIIVDHILKFETMGAEVEALWAELFGAPRSLPHRNKTKSDNRARKERVHKQIAPLVASIYAEDFKAFDYTP